MSDTVSLSNNSYWHSRCSVAVLLRTVDMIITSPHPSAHIPEGITFPEFVLKQFEEYGNKVALISPSSNKHYTYSELIKLTHNLASGLHHKLGLNRGDVFGMSMGNSCEFCPLVLSVGLLGAKICPSNPAHTVDELVDQFKKSGVRFLLTTSDLVEKMRKVQAQCPRLEKLIIKDTDMPGTVHLAKLFDGDTTQKVSYPKLNPREEVMFLLNSSGTTGLPKAVMLTHFSVVANLCQQCPQFSTKEAPELFTLTSKDVVLSAFPQFHIGGIINGITWPLIRGATCVVFPRYDPNQFFGALMKYKVTAIIVPPPILVHMVKSPDVTEEHCQTLHTVFCGAAPVTKELSHAVFAKAKPNYIIQGYGMTELSPMCHMTPLKPLSLQKHGSCGVVLPNTECKVIDIETGRALGPKQNGEICIRGPQIMKGYLDNPRATSECIDKEGWMHTGDIGQYDEDGYFFVVDRIKELIKVKGFQVAPAELEGILLDHPSVGDAAVVGIKDEYKGEIPRAYIVLKNGEKANEEEIKKHVADHVSSYKRLEGGVKFVKELPKTPSGKILRRYLRDQARQEEEAKMKKAKL